MNIQEEIKKKKNEQTTKVLLESSFSWSRLQLEDKMNSLRKQMAFRKWRCNPHYKFLSVVIVIIPTFSRELSVTGLRRI